MLANGNNGTSHQGLEKDFEIAAKFEALHPWGVGPNRNEKELLELLEENFRLGSTPLQGLKELPEWAQFLIGLHVGDKLVYRENLHAASEAADILRKHQVTILKIARMDPDDMPLLDRVRWFNAAVPFDKPLFHWHEVTPKFVELAAVGLRHYGAYGYAVPLRAGDLSAGQIVVLSRQFSPWMQALTLLKELESPATFTERVIVLKQIAVSLSEIDAQMVRVLPMSPVSPDDIEGPLNKVLATWPGEGASRLAYAFSSVSSPEVYARVAALKDSETVGAFLFRRRDDAKRGSFQENLARLEAVGQTESPNQHVAKALLKSLLEESDDLNDLDDIRSSTGTTLPVYIALLLEGTRFAEPEWLEEEALALFAGPDCVLLDLEFIAHDYRAEAWKWFAEKVTVKLSEATAPTSGMRLPREFGSRTVGSIQSHIALVDARDSGWSSSELVAAVAWGLALPVSNSIFLLGDVANMRETGSQAAAQYVQAFEQRLQRTLSDPTAEAAYAHRLHNPDGYPHSESTLMEWLEAVAAAG